MPQILIIKIKKIKMIVVVINFFKKKVMSKKNFAILFLKVYIINNGEFL